jgi:hypothetical protein
MSDAPAGEEDRPWEQPGCVRRDCLPHRGPLLLILGTAVYCLGIVSLCLPPLAVAAIALGLVTSWLARRDLVKIAAGEMDPNGLDEVELAGQRARDGMLAGLLFGAFWCCVWLPQLRP